MRILLADSDRKLADSIDGELEQALVQYAADGEVGLKFALEKRFDLIVLDWALPVKDGLSVLKELREQKILTPVLMLTDEDSVKDAVQSLDCGANDCVAKPLGTHVLVARMNALIRRSKWDQSTEIRHAQIGPDPAVSILIVGDYESSRAAMARLIALRMPDVMVHITDNHKNCMELCVLHMIDIVIVDLKMSSVGLNGMVDRVRSVRNNTKFVIIAGPSERKELKVLTDIDNNTSVIKKPVDSKELLAVIKKNISGVEVEKQSANQRILA
ncbi:MAG: hypothetical protein A2075_09590 [Geobacteraceae bacterium GWC2_58_44]|nr:MAG: hypothetical protein A2075_09590 [Geobacteraceae bacterium GWC2_58_44]